MSVLATATMLPHLAFNNDYPWDRMRSSDYFKPRTEAASIALPSIRQAIPELQLTTPSREYSRPHSNGSSGSLTPSDYVHSPNSNKRRRLTDEEDEDSLRAKQVPRIYRSPEPVFKREMSPRLRTPSITLDRWTSAPTSLPTLNITSVPAPVEVQEPPKPRITLPSLKVTMNFEGDSMRAREGPMESPSSGRPSIISITEPSRTFQSYEFSYHAPTRYQSHPSSPVGSYERPPFSAGAYPLHHHEAARFDLGVMGTGADTKQRKRRGNLPKETTDKLRAWFVAHLQHPYPTEDEKQDLMRQTGLQMNQISNWFINARRRQLPAMINNARAENEAATGNRSASGKLGLASGSDYDGLIKREAIPLSDGEGGSCDEAMDMLRRRRVGNMKRGSV
ncbi:Homeobox protein PKNOX2 [Cladobotryum mycophilum]|uniref:Homeobox protein PKNOX2 n=1 Tax=Cladobotryum mycophilum TaxID=491253 RepID=A0ABR0SB89_9HYPO